MQIREYSLPPGWFPHESGKVSAFLSEFDVSAGKSRAVIAPHAGWYYSGKLAALAISSLKRDIQIVIVLGGHLGKGSPPLFAMEDAVKTPFSSLEIDSELRSNLIKKIGGSEDRYRDNTIEVLLPMVHFFFPKARLLWLRLPSEIQSYETGKVISAVSKEMNLKTCVISSTDLTHYGANYGFSPKGRGLAALDWVRNVNDANFIKAVENGDAAEVLRCGESEYASCSAGAVLGAMGFAEAEKLGSARLMEYGTSADKEGGVPDSFVGYAALSFL